MTGTGALDLAVFGSPTEERQIDRVTFSHASESNRVLIHVDTDKSELLVNDRFAYVSVSRAPYDARIYTNDRSKLPHSLSRDNSQRTATETQQEQQVDPKIEPPSARSGGPAEEEQGHSLGMGLA
jgi:hypothetical protein